MANTLVNKDERDRAIKGVSDDESDDIHLDGEPAEVEETDDGGAIVTLEEDDAPTAQNTEHLDNLAEKLDRMYLDALGRDLCEVIQTDREARKRRDEQQELGIKRTGLGDDAPGGADFEGASKVVHPLLVEASIDFAAREMKELFPPGGPVKSAIYGNETDEKVVLAARKTQFMNWQATQQIPEYASELESLLSQLPLGGSQYMKWWYSEKFKRPKCEFVPIDRVFLPSAAVDFYTAERVTHLQAVTRQEFDQRIASGLYADLDVVITPAFEPDGTKSDAATAKVEGNTGDPMNLDGVREVYEVYTWLEVDDDDKTKGDLAPYIVTVDKESEQVVGMYRNWSEKDDTFQKLDWMVEYKLLPWRGAYGIGLYHLIGGLSGAATGALRALLDSAHINNSQALIKLKAGKGNGQTIVANPGEVAEIEQVPGVDDIRKTIMPMPYNQPSPVLFQLLGWLTDAGKGVLGTSEEKLDNIGDRTPVGTTMMMVEQGSQTYSSVHARMHRAQAKSLEILHRINRDYLDDKMVVAELGDLEIRRKDFAKNLDVVPVSDPNIFSEAQRFAQMQGLQQLVAMFPMLHWDFDKIARRMLARMRIENAQEILPEQQKPVNMNPVAENIAAQHGKPLIALPPQNHLAHIFAHLEYATSPVFANPILGAKMMPIIAEHVAQHIAFLYSETMDKVTHFSEDAEKTPTVQMEDRMAMANTQVLSWLQAKLQKPMEMLQQVQQFAQQFAPKPQPDPMSQAQLQVGMAEVQRKTQYDQQLLQQKAQELQNKQQEIQTKAQVDLVKNQQDNDQKAETNLLMNQGDNETKQWIAALEMQNANLMAEMQGRLDTMQSEFERQHALTLTGIQGQIQMLLGAQNGQQQALQAQIANQNQLAQQATQQHHEVGMAGVTGAQQVQQSMIDHAQQLQQQDVTHQQALEQQGVQHEQSLEAQQAAHGQTLEQQAQAAKLAPKPQPSKGK